LPTLQTNPPKKKCLIKTKILKLLFSYRQEITQQINDERNDLRNRELFIINDGAVFSGLARFISKNIYDNKNVSFPWKEIKRIPARSPHKHLRSQNL
jgi:hypothetical protein